MLVVGDEENVLATIKDFLGPVAMMCVYIYNHDPF
jgi:hypothetical protein